MFRGLWLLPLMLVLLAACNPQTDTEPDGPRLVLEVTLAPSEARPTRFLSPTPTSAITVTRERATAEVDSPLDKVTLDAQFILVTPTLPPSKTPTITPSNSPTPTVTPTASLTNTATATAFLLPTSEIIVITQPAAAQANRVCDSTWGFIHPPPPSCPLGAPTASQGVYQEFANGYMLWIGSLDAIYTLYKDANQPRWQVSRDFFEENNPSMSYLNDAPRGLDSGAWSPRRGFGLLWEQDAAIRGRIGGATQQWEEPFSVQVQLSDDGALFITTPHAAVFGLMPRGVNWNQFSGSLPPSAPSVQQLPSPENQSPIRSGIPSLPGS
jgi:hypothetical protein